jgi:SAM-dependent methyltransferase
MFIYFILKNNMSKLKKHKKNWESLGEMDPFWAVLSDNSKRFNNWNLKEFFETGRKEGEYIWGKLENLNLKTGRILDFGCGLGRLASFWLEHFDEYIACDISESMISQAKKINDSRAKFFLNEDDLSIFPNDHFDLIYSGIVLQHLPQKKFIKAYLLEFKRVLKPGGVLVFQLPSWIPFKYRLQPIRRLYNFLKLFSFSDDFLYNRLKLFPVKMSFVKEKEMGGFLEKEGFNIEKIESDSYCGPEIENRIYYCRK